MKYKWHWAFIFRILIAEVYGPQSTYYRNDSQPWADLHFNVELTQLNDKSSAVDIKETIDRASKLPENAWPTFLVSLTCVYNFVWYCLESIHHDYRYQIIKKIKSMDMGYLGYIDIISKFKFFFLWFWSSMF